jgi:hypothetical protein
VLRRQIFARHFVAGTTSAHFAADSLPAAANQLCEYAVPDNRAIFVPVFTDTSAARTQEEASSKPADASSRLAVRGVPCPLAALSDKKKIKNPPLRTGIDTSETEIHGKHFV